MERDGSVPRRVFSWARALLGLLLFNLLVVGLVVALVFFSRPARFPVDQALFQGISYHRRFYREPRPILLHLIRIDLATPGLRFQVTPGLGPNQGVRARTASDFVREFGVQAAMNGSFFDPFYTKLPWDYYPLRGDVVHPIGQTVADGAQYAPPFAQWPVICLRGARVWVRARQCGEAVDHALTGDVIFLIDGEPEYLPKKSYHDNPHPRAAVALNRERSVLWFAVVDGRQSGYSEGVTTWEFAELLAAQGADLAVNLDGGGSATLAIAGPRVLNSPMHTRIPLRERPVANHLGVHAPPLASR